MVDVHRNHIDQQNNLWAVERAAFHNAHFTHPVKGRHWKPEDFINTPQARAQRIREQENRSEFAAIQAAEARQLAMMKAGKFNETDLPVWARMTPDEKAQRAIK